MLTRDPAVSLDRRDARTWPEVMTPEEVADVLRLSVNVVREHLRDGAIPGHKVAGSWRVSKDRLRAYLDGAT